ncbi:MAG TPA: hypothetical protein VIC58_10595 [Actinomycetota bacterium]|jgi:hypothetical protein
MTGRTRTVPTLLLLAVPLLLLHACSGDPPPPTAGPTSAFPDDTATGPSGASGLSGAPTGDTGEGDLTEGEASFTLSGDVVASGTIDDLVSAIYVPPPGGMAIVWTAGGTNATTLGIGGAAFTGTQPTAPTLVLTLTADTDEGISSFVSDDGECSITIDAATPERITGAFTCRGLRSATGEVVDVTGSFTATG